jgi:hypothetical protein
MSVIRFSRWFRLRGTMRTAALGAALGLAVGVLILFAPEPEAASPREFRVIDGDTLDEVWPRKRAMPAQPWQAFGPSTSNAGVAP